MRRRIRRASVPPASPVVYLCSTAPVVTPAASNHDAQPSRASNSRRPAARRKPVAAPTVSQPAPVSPRHCGNTFAPIASSLPRRQPVVTTRTMPQQSKSYRWLAQVITPSDGLPDPSSIRTAQCGPPPCPLSAGFVNTALPKRPTEPWVNGSSRRIGFPQEAPSMPMPRAAAASNKPNGTNREWCPASLVVPDTPRRPGRTETLTGQALHTSSNESGRTTGATERGKEWT